MVTILTALTMTLICLLLQSVFVATCLRQYTRFRATHPGAVARHENVSLLSIVMLLMMVSIIFQISIWAVLFFLLGEFEDFTTAIYHSGVNFTGLGYGDIVMSERWRPLGPLEAANGILMFGLSTAVMTAAIIEIIKYSRTERRQDDKP